MSIREPEGQGKEETETEPTENVISRTWGDPPSSTGLLLPHPPGVTPWPKIRRPQKPPAGPLPCPRQQELAWVPRQLCRGKGDLITSGWPCARNRCGRRRLSPGAQNIKNHFSILPESRPSLLGLFPPPRVCLGRITGPLSLWNSMTQSF